MESLYTYFRIIQNYQNTPRNYGIDELLFLTEAHTIEVIGKNPGLSLNELAEKTHRTKSAMSMLIKSLAEKGLVKRARDVDDNRRYIITLTDKGQRVFDFHNNLDNENYEYVIKQINEFAAVDIKDLEITAKVLNDINKVLNQVMND